MRKIIASIDIGNDSIKLIVGEIFESRLHILSASKVDTHGLERGRIVDRDELVNSIKTAIHEANDTLGVDVEKCILSLSMKSSRINKSAAAIKIKNENNEISSKDIQDLMAKCADGKVPEE